MPNAQSRPNAKPRAAVARKTASLVPLAWSATALLSLILLIVLHA